MSKTTQNQTEVKYPKGEHVCATCYGKDGKRLFLITTKPLTECFFIYEFTGDGLIKLGKGQSPIELEEKFHVKKRMGVE